MGFLGLKTFMLQRELMSHRAGTLESFDVLGMFFLNLQSDHGGKGASV